MGAGYVEQVDTVQANTTQVDAVQAEMQKKERCEGAGSRSSVLIDEQKSDEDTPTSKYIEDLMFLINPTLQTLLHDKIQHFRHCNPINLEILKIVKFVEF